MTPIRLVTTFVEIHYGVGIVGFIAGLAIDNWKLIVVACAFWFLLAAMMICISLEDDSSEWGKEIKLR